MIREFTLTEFWVIAAGLWATLLLSGLAFVCGGIGGLGVALARTAPIRGLRLAAGVFIDFFQGTPMLLLTTSIVSSISAEELTSVAQNVDSSTFRSFEVYIVTALLYLAMSTIFATVFKAIDRLCFSYPNK